ncbi:hypothetical protein AAL_06761 [Moelleriella libera RCEF 2490]|uniref:Uncharacterized protein n=1 Tax=Moelleriella libera RCEF 2490 TaxID=1081109 RepID=A0A167YMC2_9HYPO|nr:hypothetical protein AAL_06761 [Moelleriella libera RCEF 2490]
MSRRFYLETTPTGKKQFVSVKRSRSDGHDGHHYHHHNPCLETQDYYKVKVDEWNRIKERERCLENANACLAMEINTLKAALVVSQGEAHQLQQVVIPKLQDQVKVLVTDNENLRKSLDKACQSEAGHGREEEKLKQTVEGLEREKKEIKEENSSLKGKVEHLKRQVEQGCGRRVSELIREIDQWRERSRYWKGRYEETKRLHDDVCFVLDIRQDKIRAYEEILKRRRII